MTYNHLDGVLGVGRGSFLRYLFAEPANRV